MRIQLIIAPISIGILAGLVTIYAIPAKYELLLWIVLIIAGGAIAHKNFENHPFRNGFLFAVIIGLSITLTHIVFVNDYLSSHKDELQQIEKIKIANSYRLTLLVLAPIYWAVLGLLTGLCTLLWKRLKTNHA